MTQPEFEANVSSRRQARENAYEQGTIGFDFASNWLRQLREFYQPITERRNAKTKQMRIPFDR